MRVALRVATVALSFGGFDAVGDARDLHPDITKARDLHPNITNTRDKHPDPNITDATDKQPNITNATDMHPNITNARNIHPNITRTRDNQPGVAETEQDAAVIVKAASELAHLIKTGVKQLMGEVYNSRNNRKLTWYDGKGGLGNQLGGLSGALILAGCTGRRLQLGQRTKDSISGWLWKDYFENPLPGWIAGEKSKGHRILSSNFPKKKPMNIKQVIILFRLLDDVLCLKLTYDLHYRALLKTWIHKCIIKMCQIVLQETRRPTNFSWGAWVAQRTEREAPLFPPLLTRAATQVLYLIMDRLLFISLRRGESLCPIFHQEPWKKLKLALVRWSTFLGPSFRQYPH